MRCALEKLKRNGTTSQKSLHSSKVGQFSFISITCVSLFGATPYGKFLRKTSVGDPDPQDSHAFGPPVSRSISHSLIDTVPDPDPAPNPDPSLFA
jgi:hypothetical protein